MCLNDRFYRAACFVATVCCLCLSDGLSGNLFAQRNASELKPLMVKPGKLVMDEDFSESGPVSRRTTFRGKQGTPWVSKDGALRGEANSPEEQAKRTKYKGKEARGIFPVTPKAYVAVFDFTCHGGKQSTRAPFLEFGHHVCRVNLKDSGARLIVRGLETVQDESFKFEIGRTYHIMVEMNEDEFLIQFKDGPIYYARNESISKAESHAIGLCGTVGGSVLVDRVKIWEAAGYHPKWKEVKTKLKLKSPALSQVEK